MPVRPRQRTCRAARSRKRYRAGGEVFRIDQSKWCRGLSFYMLCIPLPGRCCASGECSGDGHRPDVACPRTRRYRTRYPRRPSIVLSHCSKRFAIRATLANPSLNRHPGPTVRPLAHCEPDRRGEFATRSHPPDRRQRHVQRVGQPALIEHEWRTWSFVGSMTIAHVATACLVPCLPDSVWTPAESCAAMRFVAKQSPISGGEGWFHRVDLPVLRA